MARRLLLQLVAWTALVVATLYFTGHDDKISGFLAGTAISILYGLLVCYRVWRSVLLPTNKAVAYMRTGWLVRLAFVVLALAWSLKVPSLRFGAVVAGLLSLQLMLFINGFYLVIRHFVTK